ncbi:MAG TPA: DinB family protein [Trueperaceae bacterium]|nr:DinB family protein [Trueperaceae bacterium]
MTLEAKQRETALVLLEETFESRDKGGNYYLDERTGWFPTLDGVSAADASLALVPGGTTIAGHTFHTAFYLRVVTRDLRGEPGGRVDWAQSWTVKAVDDAGWEDVRRGLRDAHAETVALLARAQAWGEEEHEVALAALSHSAYHLGAVRQFMTMVAARRAAT